MYGVIPLSEPPYPFPHPGALETEALTREQAGCTRRI